MPYKDPEKRKEQARIWQAKDRAKNPAKYAAKHKAYRKRHGDEYRKKHAAWMRDWSKRNPETVAKIRAKDEIKRKETKRWMKYQNAQNDKLNEFRVLLLDQMGGKCSRCGFDDYRALQIDHTFGGGNKERKSGMGWVGRPRTLAQVEAVLARYYLGELSILCANCNWIKRFENSEWVPRGPRKKKQE